MKLNCKLLNLKFCLKVLIKSIGSHLYVYGKSNSNNLFQTYHSLFSSYLKPLHMSIATNAFHDNFPYVYIDVQHLLHIKNQS